MMPATVWSQAAAHRLEIDIAARVGGQLDRGEARHGGRGRVGAVGGIRNEDAGSLVLAAIAVIGAHHQEAGELAMRAGRGLQRDPGKAADLRQPLLQAEHQCEIALNGFGILQRMGLGKAREPGDLLVDLRDCISWCRSRADRSRYRRRNCAATAPESGAPPRAGRAPADRSPPRARPAAAALPAHRRPADRCRGVPARSAHRASGSKPSDPILSAGIRRAAFILRSG